MYNLRVSTFILVALLCTSGVSLAAITAQEKQILSHLDSARMMQTIERLCGDDFAGRRAGSPEQDKAIDYLSSQFKSDGLSPVPNLHGFQQPLTMRYSLVKDDRDIKATLTYCIEGRHGESNKCRVFPYSSYNGRGGLDLHSQVVFVGYGIEDPAEGHNDYAKLRVSGKIVMWLPGVPKCVKSIRVSTDAQKILTAYQHGAEACIVCKPADLQDGWGTNTGLAGTIADFPYIGMDKVAASELMAGASLTKLKPGALGENVHLQVTRVYDPARKTSNVIAYLPGSDPDRSDEVVMVGAHFDHLGKEGVGIFRGADDNASGTSVVLEVARAICSSGLRPQRSIVFACWTGEEAGLVGSNYFASNPPFPLKSIVSNIEMDMVGEGTPGKFMTTGARSFPEHYRNIARSGKDLGLSLHADSVLGASDHLAFTRKNVPTSLLYTDGLHPYYHTTRDTPAGIKPGILLSTAKLAALSIWRAANP